LTYQALATTAVTDMTHSEPYETGPSLRKKHTAATNTLVQTPPPPPDLGIWNIRIRTNTNNNNNKNEALMRYNTEMQNINSFVWTIDWKKYNNNLLETSLTALQNALIRHLVQRNNNNKSNNMDKNTTETEWPPLLHSNTTATATTSLAQLQTTQFGLANNDESYKTTTMKMENDKDRNKITTRLALMIVVRVVEDTTTSTTSVTEESSSYTAQQHQALIMYHLRKFATALHAPLVFVREGMEDTTTTTAATADASTANIPCLSTAQFALLLRAWAQGYPVWQSPEQYLVSEGGGNSTATAANVITTDHNKEEESTSTNIASAIYGPEQDTDLIETVLLRAAHYPGHWDASKDSIWKILVPPPSSPSSVVPSSSSSSSSTTVDGKSTADQGWLQELRQSVAADAATTSMLTTPTKKPSSSVKNKTTPVKTPNEAAAFFESLLK
jgi:hypothetical protein